MKLKKETGVCLNCKQNTDGINCQTCRKDYYFDMFTNRCEKCHCNLDGVEATNNTQSICNQVNNRFFCLQLKLSIQLLMANIFIILLENWPMHMQKEHNRFRLR